MRAGSLLEKPAVKGALERPQRKCDGGMLSTELNFKIFVDTEVRFS